MNLYRFIWDFIDYHKASLSVKLSTHHLASSLSPLTSKKWAETSRLPFPSPKVYTMEACPCMPHVLGCCLPKCIAPPRSTCRWLCLSCQTADGACHDHFAGSLHHRHPMSNRGERSALSGWQNRTGTGSLSHHMQHRTQTGKTLVLHMLCRYRPLLEGSDKSFWKLS